MRDYYGEICAQIDDISERIDRIMAGLDEPGARVLQRVREASERRPSSKVIPLRREQADRVTATMIDSSALDDCAREVARRMCEGLRSEPPETA